MRENSQHVYLFLTKRPECIQFETDLNNVWMGVTVTIRINASAVFAPLWGCR